MAKQVVMWEADKAGGTFNSPVLADLADAKNDVHELISNSQEAVSLHGRNRVLEPYTISEFLLNNWTELVELMPKYINLNEKVRLENKERLQ